MKAIKSVPFSDIICGTKFLYRDERYVKIEIINATRPARISYNALEIGNRTLASFFPYDNVVPIGGSISDMTHVVKIGGTSIIPISCHYSTLYGQITGVFLSGRGVYTSPLPTPTLVPEIA